ncbi:transposable element Tcb1 transposase [Trichonephila clavipes]|uniref:Transposable element Tcb1 transposase n=1 Tax=Trichonephila clavipes TaxID=2585209 RepID=A0A8X6R882_TRICX|nr:transposable element Tcb1 transposase [Trichonephila clavipes]
MTDRSVTSRTVAQHIESVTHHSVSARTIRRHLQQSGLSARRPLLGLPLTQDHRRLRRQWCDERRMWAAEWNEVVFTDESRICLQHNDGRIRVWRHRGERMLNSCIMPVTLVLHRVLWYGTMYHLKEHLVFGKSFNFASNVACNTMMKLHWKLGSNETDTEFSQCGRVGDGTWQRRDILPNGCVSVISIDSGKVLDVEFMSKV